MARVAAVGAAVAWGCVGFAALNEGWFASTGPWAQAGPEPFDDEGLAPADYQALRAFAGRVSRDELHDAMRVLDPRQLLRPWLDWDDAHVRLRDVRGEVAVEIPLRSGGGGASARSHASAAAFARPPPGRPLHGLRILLDPGHFGGAWSEAEHRHYVEGDGPVLREGDLNWGVALLLREKLQRAGAEVFLSRGAPPARPFADPPADARRTPEALSAWLRATHPELPLGAWLDAHPLQRARLQLGVASVPWRAEATVFDEISRFDLRRRGRVTFEVAPDVTLSLHHNMAKDTDTNRVVAFVPGFVLAPEADAAGAYDALRRALEGPPDPLAELALALSRAMQARLRLPGRQNESKPESKRLDLFPDDGVFARNLAVLRRARGAAVLLEGPCMNASGEYERLGRAEITLEGRRYPKRLLPYAQAVYDALAAEADRVRALRVVDAHSGSRAAPTP